MSRLGFLDLSGLLAAALAVVLDHEGDLVAFVEGEDAGRFERSGMDENVLVAVLRLDEAIALGSVEELDSTCSTHVGIPFPARRARWFRSSSPHPIPQHNGPARSEGRRSSPSTRLPIH